MLVGQDSEGGTKMHEKDTMDSNHGHGKVRVIWARKDILALRSEYFAKRTYGPCRSGSTDFYRSICRVSYQWA